MCFLFYFKLTKDTFRDSDIELFDIIWIYSYFGKYSYVDECTFIDPNLELSFLLIWNENKWKLLNMRLEEGKNYIIVNNKS